MTLKKRLATAIAVLAAASFAIAACDGGAAGTDTGGDSTASADGAATGSLTLGAITSPLTFDPASAEWGNRSPFYQAVFDTLLLAGTDGTVQPWLATEWSYNDDNTELTLTIRDDVTFSDGSALDADAVVASMQHFKDGSGPDQHYLANVDGIEASDATHVVLTLSAPDPALLNYLTRTAGLVAQPDSLTSDDVDTNPVGSGPYILDTAATVTGSSYVYTANPDYWNPDVQHYADLTIRVFDDPTATANAIQAGEVNAAKIATNDNLAAIEGAGWTINSNELDFQGLLLLDRDGSMNPALGDVRVRQAINYAFDRDGLLEALQLGLGTVTEQVFPESSAAYDPALDSTYTYDPDKAKELLAEAGYPDGFELTMPSSALLGTNTFTLVAQQLGDVGITVTYEDPGNNFIADLLAPKYAASFMALEQNPDWQLIQFMIAPGATFNPFGYSDPEVDRMIDEIQNGDEATQDEVVAELNAYIVDQAWFAPFYRVQGSFPSDPQTSVTMLPSNTFPNIYDIQPVG